MKPARVAVLMLVLALAYLMATFSTHWFADEYLVVERAAPTGPSRPVFIDAGREIPSGAETPPADHTKRSAPMRERRAWASTPEEQAARSSASTDEVRRRCAEVPRREIRARVLDPGSLRRIRVAAHPKGLALSRVSGTPLTRLGLRDGDVVVTLQGRAATIDSALALLSRVDTIDEIRATVLRGSRRVSLCAELTGQ